jgi:hypothetical protein
MLLTLGAASVMFGGGSAPAGFTRAPRQIVRPIGRRSVGRWERIAPQVAEAEACHVDFLDVQ